MIKNKKGAELSINIIIIAAIALIVLVVLIAIFTGRMSSWIEKITGTEKSLVCENYKNADGDAAKWQADSCAAGYKQIYTASDSEQHPGQYCCQKEAAEA